MPAFLRSIRFRMAITYSLVVFGLAFVVIAGVNIALSRTIDDEPVSQRSEFITLINPDGSVTIIEDRYRSRMVSLEALVNNKAQDNLRRFSLWALLGMFPTSIALGWVIADRALRPIGEISDVAKEIQASDLSRRIDLDGPPDELRNLADTFDAMLDRVEAGVTAQRDFIEDTSHELRNPLAIMKTNLDVVLADPSADAASLRAAAEVVRRTINRTSRTVDDLIVFARREAPMAGLEEVDLALVAAELAEEYEPTASARGVTIEAGGDSVDLRADRADIKRAVANLVRNAVAAAPRGSAVGIRSGVRGRWALMIVTDSGPGIAVGDHPKVFQRNWTRANSGADHGSGLGLPIARQIAEAHGGTVTLRSSPGAGAEFVLWLPLQESADLSAITADGLHHDE